MILLGMEQGMVSFWMYPPDVVLLVVTSFALFDGLCADPINRVILVIGEWWTLFSAPPDNEVTCAVVKYINVVDPCYQCQHYGCMSIARQQRNIGVSPLHDTARHSVQDAGPWVAVPSPHSQYRRILASVDNAVARIIANHVIC